MILHFAEQQKSVRPLPSDLLEMISYLLLVAETLGNTEDFSLDVSKVAAC